jgi:glycerol kinase
LDSVIRCSDEAVRKFGMMGHDITDLKGKLTQKVIKRLNKSHTIINFFLCLCFFIIAVGICNQRETTLVWDRKTGEPLYNAIVWGDTRTNNLVKELAEKQGDLDVQEICGLPIHNYFSAVKVRWLMDRIPKVMQAVEKKRALFGTVDTWIIWVIFFYLNKNLPNLYVYLILTYRYFTS